MSEPGKKTPPGPAGRPLTSAAKPAAIREAARPPLPSAPYAEIQVLAEAANGSPSGSSAQPVPSPASPPVLAAGAGPHDHSPRAFQRTPFVSGAQLAAILSADPSVSVQIVDSQPVPPDPLIGHVCEGYTITGILGRGGMGTVYLGENSSNPTTPKIAIKVYQLPPELAAIPAALKEAEERFLREASVALKLSHPNIVQTYEIIKLDGRLGYTMEYLPGEDLESYLEKNTKFPVAKAIRIAKSAAKALEAMHQKSIVHRDIKPSNIFLVSGTEEVKVLDLGLAKPFDRAIPTNQALTRQGTALGTPEYMSPEAAVGAEIDQRSDVYALGAVLYVLLSGRSPFRAPNEDTVTSAELLSRHVKLKAIPLNDLDPAIPKKLSDLVQRTLEKLPPARFQSMGEFHDALTECERALGLSGDEPISTPSAESTVNAPKRKSPSRLVVGLTFAGALATIAGSYYGITHLVRSTTSPAEINLPTPSVDQNSFPLSITNIQEGTVVDLIDRAPDGTIFRRKLGESPLVKVVLSSGKHIVRLSAPGRMPVYLDVSRENRDFQNLPPLEELKISNK
ncbi:protein kinase [Candidatus Micrarchaeota archaeon]|nr:protein kinase [Candidatus Micrarchaeota archaeon]